MKKEKMPFSPAKVAAFAGTVDPVFNIFKCKIGLVLTPCL
jgi:hypothetical protein